jgi:hypothetical protein
LRYRCRDIQVQGKSGSAIQAEFGIANSIPVLRCFRSAAGSRVKNFAVREIRISTRAYPGSREK